MAFGRNYGFSAARGQSFRSKVLRGMMPGRNAPVKEKGSKTRALEKARRNMK